MMKPDESSSNNFDRPKLLLFKFLAHQIHPFAYAVNTFLRPALDDCLGLMFNNPQDTFNVLLSLTQTFTRFAPESELIYDDIQQFAVKLKDAIDQCFAHLDANTVRQSTQLLETTHQSLLTIIQQQNTENTTYTNMYKNMSAVLTNLEKINSLPMEMQSMSFEKMSSVQKNNKQDVTNNSNGRTAHPVVTNGYANRNLPTTSNRTTTITPPPGILNIQADKLPAMYPPPNTTQSRSLLPPTDQIKTLSISSNPDPPVVSSSRPMSTVSYLNEYEIFDTSTQPTKKPVSNVASFPPRQNGSLFNSVNSINERPLSVNSNIIKNDTINEQYSSILEYPRFPSKSNNKNDQLRDVPTPAPSMNGTIRFCNTPGAQTISSIVNDEWDDETSQPTFLNPHFSEPNNWLPTYDDIPNQTAHPHITDEYIQEFGNKQNRPILHGELYMTYGTPQSGPQASCLPIGVGLSYDELTLLSCDVHRSAQNVRLFDIQSGRLRHTITSNQQMKFHRPGAIMSNARNNILIVERDSIYITESDGRYIQTISHRSIKQLYGIALFRDRYILTIDSKATDNQSAESCRILLFDPNSGQLVCEQNLTMNRQSENLLRQQYVNYISGRVFPETTSKPRFIAVRNDDIYIADLGRSLIYGTSLRNQFDLTCTTVFGGNGRGNGEMNDPSGLFIDSGGNIISADSKNDRIQLFSPDGQYKTTFKLNERIKRPSGICSNRDGTQFFVSCYLAGCVRAFNIGY